MELARGPKKGTSYRSRVSADKVSSFFGSLGTENIFTVFICMHREEANEAEIKDEQEP